MSSQFERDQEFRARYEREELYRTILRTLHKADEPLTDAALAMDVPALDFDAVAARVALEELEASGRVVRVQTVGQAEPVWYPAEIPRGP